MSKFHLLRASARVDNNCINMIVITVPFGLLPINSKFTLGIQQDDFNYIKLTDDSALPIRDTCKGITKFNEDDEVLINLFREDLE